MPTDWTINNQGTIFIFTPLTPEASAHADERFPDDCMMWGQGYVVEHRYADDILHDLAQHDFTIEEV